MKKMIGDKPKKFIPTEQELDNPCRKPLIAYGVALICVIGIVSFSLLIGKGWFEINPGIVLLFLIGFSICFIGAISWAVWFTLNLKKYIKKNPKFIDSREQIHAKYEKLCKNFFGKSIDAYIKAENKLIRKHNHNVKTHNRAFSLFSPYRVKRKRLINEYDVYKEIDLKMEDIRLAKEEEDKKRQAAAERLADIRRRADEIYKSKYPGVLIQDSAIVVDPTINIDSKNPQLKDWFCQACGTQNPGESQVCEKCGELKK
jgi:hypothetical protein